MLVILNYFDYSSMLISMLTIILAYRNGKNKCKGPLLVYESTSEGVKYRLLHKYHLKVV